MYEALDKLLAMPLVLLGINMAALKNYLDVTLPNTAPGKDPLRDLNEWLAAYGKAHVMSASAKDELTF